jgi:hypothetical protein
MILCISLKINLNIKHQFLEFLLDICVDSDIFYWDWEDCKFRRKFRGKTWEFEVRSNEDFFWGPLSWRHLLHIQMKRENQWEISAGDTSTPRWGLKAENLVRTPMKRMEQRRKAKQSPKGMATLDSKEPKEQRNQWAGSRGAEWKLEMEPSCPTLIVSHFTTHIWQVF